MNVSRETLVEVFGDRLNAVEEYARILSDAGVNRGMIGPREVDRLWERHLINCAVIAPRFPENASVADVGSGAGLPGLVLALVRPDLKITLIEPLLRRTTFLEEVIAELGLQNVLVVRARAEETEQTFDVVTARAVAALDKLAKWCMPLVRDGGAFLAMKGAAAAGEVEQARTVIKRLGGRDIVIRKYGLEFDLEVPTTLVEVTK